MGQNVAFPLRMAKRPPAELRHRVDETLARGHRIAVMNLGRIEQLDVPAKISGFPSNRFVADFIGNCNLLEVRVLARREGALRLDAAGEGAGVWGMKYPAAFSSSLSPALSRLRERGQTGIALATETRLHLHNWNNDISDRTIARFEAESRCKVVHDDYSDNEEMLTKLVLVIAASRMDKGFVKGGA